MALTLIVAAQTIGSSELEAELRDRVAAPDRAVHLLVPVQPPTVAIAAGLAAAESAAALLVELPDPQVVAEQRLEAGLRWLAGLGVTATGEIGPSDIVKAVKAIVEERDIDEVIVSTMHHRVSRWLKQDLPNRVRRAVTVPVVVVSARHDDA